MNELTENECLPNLRLKFKFEETTHTEKYENAMTLTLKGFPLFAQLRGSPHKNRKRLFLLRWLKLCDSRKMYCLTGEFHIKFHVKNDIGFSHEI